MMADKAGRARKMIIGKSADWIKRFDVDEYVDNPPMIEKLYEEKQLALLISSDAESREKELALKARDLELQSQALELYLAEVHRRSSLMFSLSLLAVVLIGIGVNVATSMPYAWTGWVMIAGGCILEVIAFFSRPQKGN